jgi:hypothetical protein
MMFRSTSTAAFVVAACGILAPQPLLAATVAAGSSANAVSATITVNGASSSLAKQVLAIGIAPPAYSQNPKVTSYSKTASLSGLTVALTAQNVSDSASSKGLDATGGVTVLSGAQIGLLSATLSSGAGTALTLSANTLVSSASFATTKAGANTATGSTSIASLTINSALFGIKNLSFTGKPVANKILFHNSDNSVVVYLNRQVSMKKLGKLTAFDVSAVVLHINNFKYGPYTISGDINIATSSGT